MQKCWKSDVDIVANGWQWQTVPCSGCHRWKCWECTLTVDVTTNKVSRLNHFGF